MSDITLSSAVRTNLLSLQNTANLLSTTQERLSTGKKVNSALDDPTAFFTAQSLDNRASDLNRLTDGIGTAVSTIEAADKAISAITDLVESAQGTARQALQEAGTPPSVEGSGVDLSSFSATGGEVLEFTVGDGSAQTVTLNAGDTGSDIVAAINALDGVSASIDDDNNLVVEGTGGEDLTIGGANAGDVGLSAATTAAPVNETREKLASQFDELRTQIDQLAKDATFNGVNLLKGDDLEVIFNEDNSSSLTLQGVDFSSGGLGIDAPAADFQTDSDINASLDNLSDALGNLRSQASTFGSNLSIVETRQSFTKDLINSLEGAAGKLTLADTNEEGANLLALQTRQQLSSTSLSFASQADQAVLRLL